MFGTYRTFYNLQIKQVDTPVNTGLHRSLNQKWSVQSGLV